MFVESQVLEGEETEVALRKEKKNDFVGEKANVMAGPRVGWGVGKLAEMLFLKSHETAEKDPHHLMS